MAKTTKNKKWFVRIRGSYLPNSWQAWLTYVPFVGYLVVVAVVSWHNFSHLVAILFIFPNWIAATVLESWVAKATS